MESQSFQTSVSNVIIDRDISNYFINNDIDFHQFVKKYVQVDKIMRNHLGCGSDVTSLEDTTTAITKMLDEIIALKSSLPNQIKESLESDIKTLLSDFTTALPTALHQTTANPNTIKDLLQNFGDKLLNLNNEKLNDLDRKTISILSNFQSNMLKDISTTLDSHSIHHKVNTINETLTTLHNNFTGNSSQKGRLSENLLYQNVLQAFPDSDVVLCRDQPDSGDIQIQKDGHPLILIDSKHCEASNVRKADLVKFYDDCQLHDACGILCNAFGGIANRGHFEIDVKDRRVFVFISNHQFDPSLFQLAVKVIYNIHSIIKDQRTDIIQLDQQLYQRLKLEYNFFLQTFNQHLDNIKQNVNALSQLTLSQLDHFFKRTTIATNSHNKPLSCHLCGTGCTTTKTLKKHLKDKHDITLKPAKRGRPAVHPVQPPDASDSDESLPSQQ